MIFKRILLNWWQLVRGPLDANQLTVSNTKGIDKNADLAIFSSELKLLEKYLIRKSQKENHL